MKLALVHDWLNQVGGAEDVLAALLELWPDSPVYTSIYAPERMPPALRAADIRTLWLNRLPGIQRHHQPFLPLYPLAWSGLMLRDQDVILSNKSGFCTALRHDERALHICYCLTPTRYLWQLEEYIERERLGAPLQQALRPLIALLRRQDYAAAQRVHHFIAISSAVRQRIRDCYERDSTLIFPPVDTRRFTPVAQHGQLEEYIERERLGAPLQQALRPLIALLRRQDYAAAQRVHHFIAISSAVRQRIRDCYERDSTLIFPPVDTQRFTPVAQHDDYLLVVARLVPYKRIDLAVRAASQLGLPLKVGGSGRDLERLRSMAGPTVEFLGRVPDAELPQLMARCRAFLFPGHEDFGITPVQAQAAGRPVIAFGAGGALDTVLPGHSGELFHEQSVEALASTLADLDVNRYDSRAIRAHALRFDTRVFTQQMRAFVEQALDAFRKQQPMVWRDPC